MYEKNYSSNLNFENDNGFLILIKEADEEGVSENEILERLETAP